MENEELKLTMDPSMEDNIVPANTDVCPGCGHNPCICDEEPSLENLPAIEDIVGCECEGEGCSVPANHVQDACAGVGAFFGTIQESVRIAWTFHLKTRKHRDHLALQEYYEDALEAVDSIIEHYQGTRGVVEEEFTNAVCSTGKDEVAYFNELKSYVISSRETLIDKNDTELWSDIDDLLGLIDTVLYKLTSFTEAAVMSYEAFVYENFPGKGAPADIAEDDEDAFHEGDHILIDTKRGEKSVVIDEITTDNQGVLNYHCSDDQGFEYDAIDVDIIGYDN